MIRVLEKNRTIVNKIKTIKAMYIKFTAKIILNGEKLEVVPLK